MNNFRLGFVFLLIIFIASLVLGGACYVNNIEVECPSFLSDYGDPFDEVRNESSEGSDYDDEESVTIYGSE